MNASTSHLEVYESPSRASVPTTRAALVAASPRRGARATVSCFGRPLASTTDTKTLRAERKPTRGLEPRTPSLRVTTAGRRLPCKPPGSRYRGARVNPRGTRGCRGLVGGVLSRQTGAFRTAHVFAFLHDARAGRASRTPRCVRRRPSRRTRWSARGRGGRCRWSCSRAVRCSAGRSRACRCSSRRWRCA